jgi:tetratricopeptide (TPR) repeat protein
VAVLLAVVTLAVSNILIRQEQSRTREEKDRAEKAQGLAEERATEVRQGLERLKAASALLDQGRQHVGARCWDDAHAAFTRALRLRPDHDSLWFERGELYASLGLWDLAAADYARGIELHEPPVIYPESRHALLRLYQGDADGYRQACRRMHERFRGTTQIAYALELVRTSVLGPDSDTAPARLVEVAEVALKEQPGNWYPLYVLGTAHYRAGQAEPAVRRLKESLAGYPAWNARALNFPVLAMAHHRLGQVAEARQALEEAARALDRWIRDRYEIQNGSWVVHRGATAVWPVPWWDWVEFELYYREAKRLIDGAPPPDDPRLHVLRARSLAGLRRASPAAGEYDKALQLSPQDPQVQLETHYNRAGCAVDVANWPVAAAEFAQASELQPGDAPLWRYLAMAHLAAADLDAYRRTCAAMLERFEKTEDRLAACNVVYACVLREDAVADRTRLLAPARVAAEVWHFGAWTRGAALYRAARYEEAVQCFESAVPVYRPRAWDWCFLAMAHHRLGHREEARCCLVEAVRWIEQANRPEEDDLSGTGPSWGNWEERVIYPMLLREAEELLGEPKQSGQRQEKSSPASRVP